MAVSRMRNENMPNRRNVYRNSSDIVDLVIGLISRSAEERILVSNIRSFTLSKCLRTSDVKRFWRSGISTSKRVLDVLESFFI